jgi:hypothetical protein
MAAMNDAAWLAYLDTLPPDHKALAQRLMTRIQTILNSDRRKTLDDVQRAERRSDRNAERINETELRLDAYEQQRALDVQAELERFAAEQLPADERDKLIGVLYSLSARVDALEREAGGAAGEAADPADDEAGG